MMAAAVGQLHSFVARNGIEYVHVSDLYVIWKQSRRWWWFNGPFSRKFQQAQNIMEGLMTYGTDKQAELLLGRPCIRKEAINELHVQLQGLI